MKDKDGRIVMQLDNMLLQACKNNKKRKRKKEEEVSTIIENSKEKLSVLKHYCH